MGMAKVYSMIKVAYLIGQMPRGEGWTKTSDYVQWTSLSRATIHRYLKRLSSLGFYHVNPCVVGKRTYYEYRLTEKGKQIYHSQKVMF
jgi:DNA-binding MarR family transcriptional regulator